MKPVDILKEARELLSDPKRWTKGAFARDSNGTNIGANGTSAVCWCASGALNYVYDRCLKRGESSWPVVGAREAERVLSLAAALNPAYSIASYNDAPERTHEELLQWFDRAIQTQESKP